jgi:hypothetical protein
MSFLTLPVMTVSSTYSPVPSCFAVEAQPSCRRHEQCARESFVLRLIRGYVAAYMTSTEAPPAIVKPPEAPLEFTMLMKN